MDRNIFNSRLRIAMKAKRLNQLQLSKTTGIPQPMISEYLSGKYYPKNDKLEVLSKALDVSVDYLTGIDTKVDEYLEEHNLMPIDELTDTESEIIKVVLKLSAAQQEALLNYLKVMR